MDTTHHRFDSFDARARHALQRARDESEREGLAYIGTEQLLLGLLAQPGGVARRVLRNFGIELEAARVSLRRLRPISGEQTQPAAEAGTSAEVGLTPTAKRMLELAVEEAKTLGHRSIGTEHLLLGLIAVGEGAAIDILQQRGIELTAVRSRTLQVTRGQLSRTGSGRPLMIGPESPLRGVTKNNVVMCRVGDLDMDAIDTLIEAGVRANRSDAAGWLIKAGLDAKRSVLDSVRDKVLEIRRIREDARALAENAEAQNLPSSG
jgi:ATP-dependent Clp protease ATP-binding subunit ClpA